MAQNKLPDIHEPMHPPISERKKQSIMEQLWLTYYNDTLYENGVITEDEHNKMRVKIKTRAISRER